MCVSQVWISLAQFEMSVTSGEGDDDAGDGSHVRRCRDVYAEANRKLKETEEKEERLMLLETWREFESEHGDARSLESVDKLMPNKVKKRRKIQTDDGVSADVTRIVTPVILCCAMHVHGLSCFCAQSDLGWEEYYDYIFPDDAKVQPNLKLLALAKQWKKGDDDDNPDADDPQDSSSDESESSVDEEKDGDVTEKMDT